MALNIKNAEVERLAAEVADLAGAGKRESWGGGSLAKRRTTSSAMARKVSNYAEACSLCPDMMRQPMTFSSISRRRLATSRHRS